MKVPFTLVAINDHNQIFKIHVTRVEEKPTINILHTEIDPADENETNADLHSFYLKTLHVDKEMNIAKIMPNFLFESESDAKLKLIDNLDAKIERALRTVSDLKRQREEIATSL